MNIISILTQQVFWTLFSFILFYTLINKYVINKINKIANHRISILRNLNQKGSLLAKKSQELNLKSELIIKDEIEARKDAFISAELENYENELEDKIFQEKEILNEKIKIDKTTMPKKIEVELEKLAKDFLMRASR
jgi:hypothetical protein